MKLYIGNKNYSSWSMRPWVLMREFGIPFEEVLVRFDGFDDASTFKRRMLQVSPAGRVPVLVLDDGFAIWDTLAIAESIAERFPQHALWPRDANARARARSLACEMHSGFSALRSAFPQNIEASLPEVGAELLKTKPQVVADLARVDALWSDAVARSRGPFLFGEFGIVDAMYAPVVGRVRTYGLPLSAASAAYGERVWGTRSVQQWVKEALDEREYLDFEEPYRQSR